jgi:hypothetical protein
MVMAMGIQELFTMGVGGDYEGKKKDTKYEKLHG